MTVSVDEFIRRFLLHVLPDGMHRIRHFGILANGCRARTLESAREALGSILGGEHLDIGADLDQDGRGGDAVDAGYSATIWVRAARQSG